MFGLGKKKTKLDYQVLNEELTTENRILIEKVETLERSSRDQKNLNGVLEEKVSALKTEKTDLEAELAELSKKANVKLKVKLPKGIVGEFAEFEAQIKSNGMSDSQKMYAALTVAKKAGGRTYLAEASTVGEMKNIIKQVRQGKLIVIGR